MATPLVTRHAARVFLLDGEGRLLLFEARIDVGSDDVCWFTPGGGIEEGESPAEAASRELREETGIRIGPADLGDTVAWAAGPATFTWGSGYFRDDFFVARVDNGDVDVSGQLGVERQLLLRHRWWTLDELRSATVPVYPWGLTPLLTDLLSGRRPAEPVHLPWHYPEAP